MKNVLARVNSITAKVEKVILSLSILLMMINTTANALGRYIFNQSIYFSEELNQFLMVSVTFVGLAYAVRNGRNIRMTAIYDALSHKKKKFLMIIIAISTSMLMFLLAYEAYNYVMQLKEINRLSPALQIEVYLVYMIVPIGFFMSGVQFFIRFIQNLLHDEIYLSYDVIEEKDCDSNIGDQAC
ncbi:TRAP transporter small permease [Poseidonibacter lekithochrous]|uniref:TRAP transporter small permease n=1 Tax=Poseidonibacter lekithochrous TaxID=1904463 RepID=UPI0008FCC685|nr:TRAP transporter small permease [Poseidonibacter lekithochrous]QKJ21649.1 putative osmoregulatory TRAP transporter, small permease subunit, UehB/TeaB family [Poseidonibacter lekithochrous]